MTPAGTGEEIRDGRRNNEDEIFCLFTPLDEANRHEWYIWDTEVDEKDNADDSRDYNESDSPHEEPEGYWTTAVRTVLYRVALEEKNKY